MSEQEVSDIIKSLSNSSAGWDEFPISIAKQCSKNFVKSLTALINSSFWEGVFPCELKKARVVPIYKTGDKSLINNYRPISVLSFNNCTIFLRQMTFCMRTNMDSVEDIPLNKQSSL